MLAAISRAGVLVLVGVELTFSDCISSLSSDLEEE